MCWAVADLANYCALKYLTSGRERRSAAAELVLDRCHQAGLKYVLKYPNRDSVGFSNGKHTFRLRSVVSPILNGRFAKWPLLHDNWPFDEMAV